MGMYFSIIAAGADECRQIRADPDSLEDFLGKRGKPAVRIEKSWHGLHYLLTGSADGGDGPAAFLLLGGEPVGDDMGYGPPRLMSPADVAALDGTLAHVSDDQLWSRFDPSAMEENGVYPGIWDEPEEDLREEYLMYFNQVKDFVHQAAGRKQGLLLLLS